MTDEPIAIIGYGCVLPGAANADQFWQVLIDAKPQFGPVPIQRWGIKERFLSSESVADTSYSDRAAFVDDGLFLDKSSPLPRLHQMMGKAVEDALSRIFPVESFKKSKVGVVLGCMSAEDAAAESFLRAQGKNIIHDFTRFYSPSLEDLSRVECAFYGLLRDRDPLQEVKENYINSLSAYIHEKLGTQGPAFCVDSACASSLSALDVALQYLRKGLVDVVLSGGAEGNLGLEAFIPFSRLGVLSRNHSYPFDSRSDGIIQGEGAVIFVLERLSDAIKHKRSIHGVIHGISSSSNGSQASLFSPSEEEQEKINGMNSEKFGNQGLIYIEGHGTGTPVGDQAELKALEKSFLNCQDPIYLGSVKSLIGHTKGAAGAAGLLKCLLILKHQLIPASPYFESFPEGVRGDSLKINRTPYSFRHLQNEALQMRVNSSGFGGANYQLVLSPYRPLPEQTFPSSEEQRNESVVVSGYSEVSFLKARELVGLYKWKIPPNSLDRLEVSQWAALVAVKQALEASLISVSTLNPARTAVIYSSVSRTEGMEQILESIHLKKISLDSSLSPSLRAQLFEFSHHRHTFSENSCQSICSMMSGRIAQEFNFNGVNFHLDADLASPAYSLQQAQLFLEAQLADTVILLANDEKPQANQILLQRHSMKVWILCREGFALKQDLPILGKIEKVAITHD